MDERKEPAAQRPREEAAPQRPVDEQGRPLVDENGEPIRWATPRDRAVAWALALIVIGITVAFAYAIATGDIFFR